MNSFQKLVGMFCAAWLLVACSEQQHESSDQSQNVTIYRDAYGVPHIHGGTDGDAAFGMAYAQAEDNFAQLELNFILAVGRSAELFGEEALLSDWVVKAFEISEFSRRDYENAQPSTKALLDGYAAGLNHYLLKNPNVKPRLLTQFEPWYPLALIRRMYYTGGFLGRLGFTPSERQAAFEAINGRSLTTAQVAPLEMDPVAQSSFGSNSWAANGPKIEGTGSYLFINPHLPAFGMGQVYEAHMLSDQGWNFTGYSRFGFPLPYVGFGENLGWASTNNYGDQEDAWIEHFGAGEHPLDYRYGDGFRRATAWQGEIRVKDGGVKKVKFLKTHHGPVVAMRDGKFLSARLATYEEPGWLDQWHAMSRAQNFDEFVTAVSPLKMQFGNYMYADRESNIFFVYNGAFPKKDEKYDWNNPVDGSDPGTEWQGYHALDEIPQVLNAESHFIQNTNTTPFMTSMSRSDPKPDDFPAYMVREGDNARSRNARRILTQHDMFDFTTWERESLDTTMIEWQVSKPLLFTAFEAVCNNDPTRAESLEPVMAVLAAWDGTATLEAVAPTVYADWYEAAFLSRQNQRTPSSEEMISTLEQVVTRLIQDWGGWRITWGQINRAQRPELDQKGVPQFCDTCDSIATPGVPGWSGGSHISFNGRLPGVKKRYMRGGNSYTSIVDFPKDKAERLQAKSIHVFGASVDNQSPHNMDQAKLLARKEYKTAWFYLDEVQNNAVRSYQPGQEK